MTILNPSNKSQFSQDEKPVSTFTDVYSGTTFSAAQDATSPTHPTSDVKPSPVELSTPNELERLRDILYGRKSKATDERLGALETQLRILEEQVHSRLVEETSALREDFLNELESLRKQFSTSLEQQVAQIYKDMGTLQKELTERLENQDALQAEQLRATKKALTEKIESLTMTSVSQIREVQHELTDRLQSLALDQTERMRNLQVETRKRDDVLRTELVETSSTLGAQKVSRRDMVQILVELAQRLQNED